MERSNLSRALILIAFAGLVFSGAFAIIAEEAATPAPATGVQKVEPKYVCMVNDSLFPKEQIAVEVEGRTYYGCCEMCKERLAKDATSREAVDPVSGKAVDKAKATIGAQTDGKVLYFENEENLTKYNTMQAGEHGSGHES